jgi:hypothetical protein
MYSHCQKDSEISHFAIDVLQTDILNRTSYIRIVMIISTQRINFNVSVEEVLQLGG